MSRRKLYAHTGGRASGMARTAAVVSLVLGLVGFGGGCTAAVGGAGGSAEADRGAYVPVAVVEGSVDLRTGEMVFEDQLVAARTTAITEITVDSDGVPDSASTTDVVELVTTESSSDTFTPAGCSGSLPEFFCGRVVLRSFYTTDYLADAFIEFTSISGGAVVTNGMSKSPGSSGLDHLKGLFRYGNLQPDGDVYESSERLWEIDLPPSGLDRFSFSALVWANVESSRPNLVASVNGRGNNPPNGGFANPVVSEDGRYVVFQSLQALDPRDSGFSSDIYRYDRETGEVDLVSVNSAGTSSGNGASVDPAVSADGNIVVFTSRATDLIAGEDRNGTTRDIFLRDLNAGTTEVASLRRNGEQTRNTGSGSELASISDDGCYIAFQSDATNLVNTPSDTNGVTDVFLRRRCSGSATTWMMSVTDDGSALATGRFGVHPSVSDDGCRVAWESNAGTKTVTDIAHRSPGGANNIFIRDRCMGETTLASTRTDGRASANGGSSFPTLSGDGTLVAYESVATDIVSPDPNGATSDIFIRTISSGSVTRVGGSGGGSFRASFARDGSYVAFESEATDLVTGDTNGLRDCFLHDVGGGTTTRESVLGATEASGGASRDCYVNDDGSYLVFRTDADNLYDFDDNNGPDILVRRTP